MPIDTSNPLYQNITDTANAVKSAYQNQPTFTNTMQQGITANDPTLNSNINDYSGAVAELFAHDKNMAASQTTPSFAPTGYVADPMIAEKYNADMFANRGQRVADTLNVMEKRKAFLGDIVDKALKTYEAGINGKKMDYDNAKDMLDYALKEADLQIKRDSAGEEKTRLEREKKEAISKIEKRAKEGATIAQLFDEFGQDKSLDQQDVLTAYNDTNYYGRPADEKSDRVARMWESAKAGFGSTDILGNLTADERKTIEPATRAVTITDAIRDRMKELNGGDMNFASNLKPGQFGIFNKFNKKLNNDQTLKEMILRLTAEDRQRIFGSAFTEQEQKIAKDWLIGNDDMTNEMWSKINSGIITNKAIVDSALLSRVSPEELKDYWDRQKKVQVDFGMASGATGKGISTEVNDSEFKSGF